MHFVGLVFVNEDYEELEDVMAKYDEDMSVEPYIRGVVSDKDKKLFLDFYSKAEHAKGTFDKLYAKYGEKWNDNGYKKNADGVWEEWSTYNPNSKWDWFSIGGRWSKTKRLTDNGEYCDSCYLCELNRDIIHDKIYFVADRDNWYESEIWDAENEKLIPYDITENLNELIDKYMKENPKTMVYMIDAHI